MRKGEKMFEIICQVTLYIVFAFAVVYTLCFMGVVAARIVAESAKELKEIINEFLSIFEKEKESYDL